MSNRRLLHHTIWLKKDRYHSGDRKLRTEILNELQRDFHKPRKTLVRLFARAKLKAQPNDFERRSGRPRLYNEPIRWWLETLWINMDQMNSKAMHAAFPTWLKFQSDPQLTDEIKAKLLSMSPSTIDRLLKNYRRLHAKKLRSGTRRSHVRRFEDRVPLRRFEDRVDRPGFMEADTVAHCGESMSGRFAWTLDLTDHLSGWTECHAVWHKEAPRMVDALCDIQLELPFLMWGFHSDNGMEFLNEHVFAHLKHPRDSRILPVEFTRGRPYHKNDQARVEQKNFTHVRRLIGYARIDDPALIPVLNDIYRNEHRLLLNFFFPQRKLIEKIRVGAKIKKRFDKPQSPYERLMASTHVSQSSKEKLRAQFESLNPFSLKRTLDEKLRFLNARLNSSSTSSDGSQNGNGSAAA